MCRRCIPRMARGRRGTLRSRTARMGSDRRTSTFHRIGTSRRGCRCPCRHSLPGRTSHRERTGRYRFRPRLTGSKTGRVHTCRRIDRARGRIARSRDTASADRSPPPPRRRTTRTDRRCLCSGHPDRIGTERMRRSRSIAPGSIGAFPEGQQGDRRRFHAAPGGAMSISRTTGPVRRTGLRPPVNLPTLVERPSASEPYLF